MENDVILQLDMLVVCSNPETGRDYNMALLDVIKSLENYYQQLVVLNTTFIQTGEEATGLYIINGKFPNDVKGKFDIIWFAGCNFIYGWLFNEKDSVNKFKNLLKNSSIFFFTEHSNFDRIDKSISPFVIIDDLMIKEMSFILMKPEDIEEFYQHFKCIVKPVNDYKYIYKFK